MILSIIFWGGARWIARTMTSSIGSCGAIMYRPSTMALGPTLSALWVAWLVEQCEHLDPIWRHSVEDAVRKTLDGRAT